MKITQNLKYIAKYSVLLSRNNPLILKGLKSVDLRIIQMDHFRLNWKSYTVCNIGWTPIFFEWDSYFLPDGSPERLFSKS